MCKLFTGRRPTAIFNLFTGRRLAAYCKVCNRPQAVRFASFLSGRSPEATCKLFTGRRPAAVFVSNDFEILSLALNLIQTC
jgi:hypothetical protein